MDKLNSKNPGSLFRATEKIQWLMRNVIADLHNKLGWTSEGQLGELNALKLEGIKDNFQLLTNQ